MNVRYYNHENDSYVMPYTVNFTSSSGDDAPLTNENAQTNYLNKTQTTTQTVEGNVEFKQGIIVNGVQEFNGDLETSDGILEHLITEASIKPSKNFGSMAQYTDNITNKYKGYIIEKDTDRLHIFTDAENKPTQETDLNTLSKGSIVVREPINNNEVATKNYTDTKLDKTGGNISGNLSVAGNLNLNGQITQNCQDLSFIDSGRIVDTGGRLWIQTGATTNEIRFSKFGSSDMTMRLNTNSKVVDFFGNINLSVGNVLNFGSNTISNIVGGDDYTVIRGGADHFFAINQLRIDSNVDYRLNNHKITEMANGTAGTDAVNLNQLNTKLNLSGGTMSGDINLNGNDLINCEVVRPQGLSLQLLSQNQAGGLRIFNSLVDIFSDVRMNANKISFLDDGTADNDAVNLKQLKEFNKQAYNLSGSSSNNGIGTHTFTLPTTLTASTQFLITITLKMNFTGTFSATNQINAQIQQLKDDNTQITSNTDNFYVNINDLGSFKFINGVSKTIITALSLTKKIKIDLFDNYTSGTSKSFNHMLEIERL